MKDVKKQVDEANEITRLIGKDITYTTIYVSKFDNQSIYGGSGEVEEMKTEIEIKVENFETG